MIGLNTLCTLSSWILLHAHMLRDNLKHVLAALIEIFTFTRLQGRHIGVSSIGGPPSRWAAAYAANQCAMCGLDIAAEEEEHRRRREELGWPRTPKPTGMGMSEDDDEHEQDQFHKQAVSDLRARSPSPSPSPAPAPVFDGLTERLNALAKQLETALELSRSLRPNMRRLQAAEGVGVAAPGEPSIPAAATGEARIQERESLTTMFSEWKKGVEGRWSSVQEDWSEETVTGAAQKVETGLLASFQAQYQHGLLNDNTKPHTSGGLVTSPGLRSLSDESTQPRQRRKCLSSSRSRTQSRSISPPTTDGSTAVNDAEGSKASFSGPRRRSFWSVDDSSDSEGLQPSDRERGDVGDGSSRKMPFPITPKSSVINQPISTSSVVTTSAGRTTDARAHQSPNGPQTPYQQASQVFSITILVVTAAAVFW
ncbi:hypothetical protein V8D89_014772 [Ganoderma adspersum]